ncbi:MAG: RDD family protein, partial [Propionibacteriaceae bacterium]|nr:RDD family protein [Propionibacteriaceae bacterium]
MIADEILTGEGVALTVPVASVLARAGAWLIDALIAGVELFAAFWALAYFAGDVLDEALAVASIIAIVVLVLVGVPMAVERLTHGRSVGKLAFGLQVLRDDGGPIRLRHAAIRQLIALFELWLTGGGMAFLVSIFNDRGKRVGDFLAGTYVANIRGVRLTPLALAMPAELAGWAGRTDIRPIPDGLAMRARQFLARAAGFPPAARARLGLRIAAQLEQYVAPS